MTPDPAVESWSATFAAMAAASADPAVHAVAGAARFLLLHGHLMPPSEQAAMREELEASDPVDLPVVLAAWHTIAVLSAGAGSPQPPRTASEGTEALTATQSHETEAALGGVGKPLSGPRTDPQRARTDPETPSRQVPAQTQTPQGDAMHPFERKPVPHPLDEAEPAPLPRRFATLTPAQLDLAQELTRRADTLRRNADGELSLAEAVTIAAVQMGHYTTTREVPDHA